MQRIFIILAAIVLLASAPAAAQTGARNIKSESIVHIDGANYYIHNVRAGETLYSLSRLYGVTEDDVKSNNPFAREGLRPGQVLKIPVREQPVTKRTARLFEEHTVRQGETAYSIARSYGISVNTLVEDNPGIDPTLLPIDAQLNIRKKEMGQTQSWEIAKQWEDYRDAANQVSDEYIYHIVKPGETLYSLSRMFGVPYETIKELNQLEDGLKANGIIRIPATPELKAQTAQATEPAGQENTGRTESQTFGSGVRHPRLSNTPNIAVMLPLEGSANNDFVDFYRGALLALDDLKAAGHSLNVKLYNTDRTENKVYGIVSSAAFLNTDLIIGPVYESVMAPAVRYADGYRIPIVSPLASVRELDSDMLYQMAPDPATKYDKLRDLFHGGKNVILVSSGSGDDKDFEREITAELGAGNYGRFTIGSSATASLIDWNRENVFVILAGTEIGVDKALASISSAYNNASARTSRKADITVVGSSRWAGYSSTSIDKNLYFKLNVCFVTSYYVDRTNEAVARFEGRFLESYGDFPSRAAYRGYDAVKLFAGALVRQGGAPFSDKLAATNASAPLQTPYRFVQTGNCKRYVNDQWTLVSFKNNYEIEVK